MTDKENAVPGQGVELDIFDVINILLVHKKILLAVPLIVAVCVIVVSFMLPDRYTATLKIAPSKAAPLYVWMLNSESLAEHVSSELALSAHYAVSGKQKTYEELKRHVKIENNVKDGFVDVSVTDVDPTFAARLANAFGKSMVDQLLALRLTDTSQELFKVQSRREVAATNLADARAKLAAPEFKAQAEQIPVTDRYGIVSMAGIQAEAVLQGAPTDLGQSEIIRLQEQIASLQKLVVGGLHGTAGGDQGMRMAVLDLVQREAYWSALTERLDRRHSELKKMEKEEIKLIEADVPDLKSGPRRAIIVLVSVVLALFASILFVLGGEAIKSRNKNKLP